MAQLLDFSPQSVSPSTVGRSAQHAHGAERIAAEPNWMYVIRRQVGAFMRPMLFIAGTHPAVHRHPLSHEAILELALFVVVGAPRAPGSPIILGLVSWVGATQASTYGAGWFRSIRHQSAIIPCCINPTQKPPSRAASDLSRYLRPIVTLSRIDAFCTACQVPARAALIGRRTARRRRGHEPTQTAVCSHLSLASLSARI